MTPSEDNDSFDGIILRTYPYGEADLVLRVLSPIGAKRSVIAKHARREKTKFKVNFDVFDAGRFETKSGRGSLEVLTDFKTHKALPKIRNDIDVFIVAMLIVECFDVLVHEHAPEAQEYYETLALGLRALNESPNMKETLRICFMTIHTLLRVAGFGSATNDPPSLKNLHLVIDRVEQSSEKQLATKTEMRQLLIRWEQQTREAHLRGE